MDFAEAKRIASRACRALGHKVTGEVNSYPLVKNPSTFSIKCHNNCGIRLGLRRFDNGTWDVTFNTPGYGNGNRVITLLDYDANPQKLKDIQYRISYCLRIRALM